MNLVEERKTRTMADEMNWKRRDICFQCYTVPYIAPLPELQSIRLHLPIHVQHNINSVSSLLFIPFKSLKRRRKIWPSFIFSKGNRQSNREKNEVRAERRGAWNISLSGNAKQWGLISMYGSISSGLSVLITNSVVNPEYWGDHSAENYYRLLFLFSRCRCGALCPPHKLYLWSRCTCKVQVLLSADEQVQKNNWLIMCFSGFTQVMLTIYNCLSWKETEKNCKRNMH